MPDAVPDNPLVAPHAALRETLAAIADGCTALDSILNESSEAMIAFTADRRIVAANPRAEALLGYGRGALVGMKTDELLPPRMRQPDAPPMTALADIVQVEVPGMRADGSELVVDWLLGSVASPTGETFLMIVRDRAIEDRAIEQLRASEERFRLLVDGVRDYAIFMLDATGRVSSWNRGAQRIKGWEADEIIGKPYEWFFTPEDRAAGVPQQLLAGATKEGVREVIGRRVRKDGSHFQASAYLTALRRPDGELYGFAKITRDLTEKVQAEQLEQRLLIEQAARAAAEEAEQNLRASEERLRRLQRVTAALSEAATLHDVARVILDQSLTELGATSGVLYVLAADGETLRLLGERGHPPEFVPLAAIPMRDRAPLADAVRVRRAAFYSDAAELAHMYPEILPRIGTAAIQACAVIPLMTHGNLVGGFSVHFAEHRAFDTIDQSILLTIGELFAQALERAQLFTAESGARAAAEGANRSKDEFLAILGHELRNPLAPIVTALSLLERHVDEPSQRALTAIDRHVKHLMRLVDDLLDVSRITEQKIQLRKERCDLSELVARAIELARPLFDERRHHLEAVVPPGIAVVADPTRIVQVLSNLLNNAAKYTPAGGHISITGSARGDRAELEVRDDGLGIDPAMLSRVFERFTQERQSLDRSQGGLGLGLAIVKSLVAMHDGTVSAFSEGLGRGSVFTVSLPLAAFLAEAHHEAAVSNGAALLPLTSPSRRVLVVDDNIDAAELMTELLRNSGHDAISAPDGATALRLVETFRPDVALLDIGLPVMDGFELARRLRAQFDTVRLIALTGYGQADDLRRALAAGFDVHMVKPVDIAALRAAVAGSPAA